MEMSSLRLVFNIILIKKATEGVDKKTRHLGVNFVYYTIGSHETEKDPA